MVWIVIIFGTIIALQLSYIILLLDKQNGIAIAASDMNLEAHQRLLNLIDMHGTAPTRRF